MSVRAWKRVITLCVVITIAGLAAAVAGTSIERRNLEKAYADTLNNEYIVDLSEYGLTDEEELKGFFSYINYMNNFDANQSMEYQTKYSGLYVENDFIFEETNDKKVCYLTFDDGPDRNNTARVLDVLKEYDVKATFFVVYKDYKEERALYKRIVEEGHTIGVHTASHNYNKIYSSVDAYLDDFSRCAEQIESVTGVKPEVFRFPGGSVNGYNSQIYREIIAEMTRRGYTYYDWNVSCGDAAAVHVSSSKIVNNVLSSSNGIKRKIILMHDGTGHSTTADALPRIIEGLRKQGYEMEAITKEVKPVCFGYDG